MKKGLLMIVAGLAFLVAGAITAKAQELQSVDSKLAAVGVTDANIESALNSGITVSGIDIKGLVSNTRAGVWLPLKGGRTFKTLYTPLIWAHSAAGVEYAALDVGAAAPGDLTEGVAFVSIGFRVDNILDRMLGISAWVKTHISAAKLPSMEVGAGPIMYQNKIRWGASAALKF